MSEVVGECWPGCPVGVLTGPNLAAEVCAGQPTASVIAYRDENLAASVRALSATDALRIYTNPDVTGCEIAGVAKNVMAIASGMAIGLGLGTTRAALITRSLAELTRLGVALGGDPPTFAGLAGLGDLVATCTSAKSRNFSVGVSLGEGTTLSEATGSTQHGRRGCAELSAGARAREPAGCRRPRHRASRRGLSRWPLSTRSDPDPHAARAEIRGRSARVRCGPLKARPRAARDSRIEGSIRVRVPTIEVETELLSGTCRVVVGVDEVGRGAWAGPLTVGAVAVSTARSCDGCRMAYVIQRR